MPLRAVTRMCASAAWCVLSVRYCPRTARRSPERDADKPAAGSSRRSSKSAAAAATVRHLRKKGPIPSSKPAMQQQQLLLLSESTTAGSAQLNITSASTPVTDRSIQEVAAHTAAATHGVAAGAAGDHDRTQAGGSRQDVLSAATAATEPRAIHATRARSAQGTGSSRSADSKRAPAQSSSWYSEVRGGTSRRHRLRCGQHSAVGGELPRENGASWRAGAPTPCGTCNGTDGG